jgi:hypothetical protein
MNPIFYTASTGVAALCFTAVSVADHEGLPRPYKEPTHRYISTVAATRSSNMQAFVASLEPRNRLLPFALVGFGAQDEDCCGRFMNHFHDPISGRGLLWGESSIAWGLGDASNEYGAGGLHTAAMAALTATEPQERRDAAERLFLTVGHQVHLVQDLWQPSHTRNDAHPFYSLLETWCGTNAVMGNYAEVSTAVNGAGPITMPTARAFFETSATLSNHFFFSDDTIFSDYPHPMFNDVSWRPELHGSLGDEKLYNFAVAGAPGANGQIRLARQLLSAFESISNRHNGHTLESPADVAIREQARALLTMATGVSIGYIDYMFRAGIQVRLVEESGRTVLEIANSSDPSRVADPLAVSLTGGIQLYYETVNHRRLPWPSPDASIPIASFGVGSTLRTTEDVVSLATALSDPVVTPDPAVRMSDARRVFAVFNGTGGQDLAFAMDSVQVGVFRISRIELDSHSRYVSELPQEGDVEWEGNPTFPVTEIIDAEGAAIGPYGHWERLVQGPVNPIRWGMYCNSTQCLSGHYTWTWKLRDANGHETPPVTFEFTYHDPHGGFLRSTGQPPMPAGADPQSGLIRHR